MKKTYTLIQNKDKTIIRMNTAQNIGLFNAICEQSGAKQLLAPNNTRALPQRLIQTNRPVFYLTEKGEVVDLPAGSYVAAYHTPQSARIKGLYYVAPITQQDVQKLKQRAEKFGIPFGKKRRPDLFALPSLSVSEMAFERLLAGGQARLIYKSPTNKTPLIKVIEILPKEGVDALSLVVEDKQGRKRRFSEKIYAGQILALAKGPKDDSIRLCFIMPEDCAGIIAQDRLMCRKLGIKTHTMRAIKRIQHCLSREGRS